MTSISYSFVFVGSAHSKPGLLEFSLRDVAAHSTSQRTLSDLLFKKIGSGRSRQQSRQPAGPCQWLWFPASAGSPARSVTGLNFVKTMMFISWWSVCSFLKSLADVGIPFSLWIASVGRYSKSPARLLEAQRFLLDAAIFQRFRQGLAGGSHFCSWYSPSAKLKELNWQIDISM